MTRWLAMKSPFGALAFATLLMAGMTAQAADMLDAYQGPRPGVIAGDSGGRILDPRCRVIPQPEANLYGDTTRFRQTVVCMSRGMLADSFGPYPFYYPYYTR
jgi:hypothetical protein